MQASEIACKPVLITSCGFLIKENEHGIVLALDMAEDGDCNDYGFIPRECVVSRIVLLAEAVAALDGE
jgi:hypothetical protein